MTSFRTDLYGSGLTSVITSSVYFVGDAEELTAFLDIDSETTCVIQGSNAIGFRTAIAAGEWSTVTTATSVGANTMVDIEPGFRWLRGIRETASNASWAGLVLGGRNVTRRS